MQVMIPCLVFRQYFVKALLRKSVPSLQTCAFADEAIHMDCFGLLAMTTPPNLRINDLT